MDAFFLLDKPTGITSFWALREVRKKLWIKKLGHTGTLDPLATGCLLVATGNYTKLIPYLEKSTKTYECSILLDGVSDSFDIDTPVTYLSPQEQNTAQKNISQDHIQDVIDTHFSWKILQTPPVYSALKIGGKKAVDLVRAGKTPEMKPRTATIHSNTILDYSYPRLSLSITVSAGTYIRSIAHDLWHILWTGWYIESLRRTQIGDISIDNSTSFETLSDRDVLDEKRIFGGDRFVKIDDATIKQRLSHGQKISGDFDISEGIDMFVLGNEKIEYVVRYEDGVLRSVKKI